MVGVGGLDEDGGAVLDAPADEDGERVLAVALGDVLHDRVLHASAPSIKY